MTKQEGETPAHYYTIQLVDSPSVSEIDFDLYEDIIPEWDSNSYNDYFEIDQTVNKRSTDGYPIKIEVLEKLLAGLKEKGCNYVSLEHHVDHIGYNLDGLKIYKSTHEEIQANQAKYQKEAEKYRKIQELTNQINAIQFGDQ